MDKLIAMEMFTSKLEKLSREINLRNLSQSVKYLLILWSFLYLGTDLCQ